MRYRTILVLGLTAVSVALASLTPAYAQDGWTDAGTVVHLTTQSDRVGIGTTAPSTKLHVTGGVRVDGTVSTNIVTSRSGADLRLRAEGVDVLRLERTTGSPNIIGGASVNQVLDGVQGATISGGGDPSSGSNVVSDDFGTVGGGFDNRAGDDAGTTDDAIGATVGGGIGNRAQGDASTIGGGAGNVAGGVEATVGGGRGNVADGVRATVAGGDVNVATGSRATVGGGAGNIASGLFSTVPGGRRGQARHTGSFVWADSTNLTFPSQANNQFRVRSTGGAQFATAVDGVSGAATAGVVLAPGGGSWASSSDRSLKANIAAVDGVDILRRLSAIPITRWNLKAQNPGIKHVGPMAQDFYAAFELGEDERYINSADVDGIALVSIQALHQMVTALQEKTAAIDRKAADLDGKMAHLERIAAGVEELRARLIRFERAAAAR